MVALTRVGHSILWCLKDNKFMPQAPKVSAAEGISPFPLATVEVPQYCLGARALGTFSRSPVVAIAFLATPFPPLFAGSFGTHLQDSFRRTQLSHILIDVQLLLCTFFCRQELHLVSPCTFAFPDIRRNAVDRT